MTRLSLGGTPLNVVKSAHRGRSSGARRLRPISLSEHRVDMRHGTAMGPRMDEALVHDAKAELVLNAQGSRIALENSGSDEALPIPKHICEERGGRLAHEAATPEWPRQPIAEHRTDLEPGNADHADGHAVDGDRVIGVAPSGTRRV